MRKIVISQSRVNGVKGGQTDGRTGKAELTRLSDTAGRQKTLVIIAATEAGSLLSEAYLGSSQNS